MKSNMRLATRRGLLALAGACGLGFALGDRLGRGDANVGVTALVDRNDGSPIHDDGRLMVAADETVVANDRSEYEAIRFEPGGNLRFDPPARVQVLRN